MAWVLVSTLSECWGTDGWIMAGAVGVACVALSWVTAVAVIDVSNLSCAAARNMRVRQMQ
jgi:hypothetical protein